MLRSLDSVRITDGFYRGYTGVLIDFDVYKSICTVSIKGQTPTATIEKDVEVDIRYVEKLIK